MKCNYRYVFVCWCLQVLLSKPTMFTFTFTPARSYYLNSKLPALKRSQQSPLSQSFSAFAVTLETAINAYAWKQTSGDDLEKQKIKRCIIKRKTIMHLGFTLRGRKGSFNPWILDIWTWTFNLNKLFLLEFNNKWKSCELIFQHII